MNNNNVNFIDINIEHNKLDVKEFLWVSQVAQR